MTIIGIHTNAQNKSLDDLVSVWRHADDLGYGWISCSDHLPDGTAGQSSNEATVAHALMAANTRRATCGVLAYCAGFRHPSILASAVTAVDHVSNGRAAVGLGAGSAPKDFELWGFPFPSVATRMDVLEEAARCVTSLLHEDRPIDFEGTHFQLRGAQGSPRPVQPRLPVWIGTAGERRGLAIAARYADGWNSTFLTPEVLAHKRGVLDAHCERIGRDPAEIRTSVNLFLGVGQHEGKVPAARRDASLMGQPDEVAARIEEYAAAGADQVNLFLFHPFDHDSLSALAEALGLVPA